ncbi:cell wall / vacuolar inhibitor of fructosidase 1-like [Mangifera indica]|uniref:cell wall / vacuolar inhibitor of fructosidase 1-like n=1 Tax=Mangifera indica TaxID=29780 RepID=UPI001CFB871F|nr:cell wall / vacuolar inhibitor of fructosidase 1-like [Mangifera indica]
MKSFTPLKLIIVVYGALFMGNFPGSTYSAPTLIETTCKRTPHYDLCIKTRRSDPKSSRADVKGLAYIAAMGILNEGMANDMDQVFLGITKGNPRRAIDGASNIPNQTGKCEKSFAKSPLTSDNQLVNDLVEVVVSIVKTLRY